MVCKTCKEWEKELYRHKEVARVLSIKLANLQEEYAIIKEENSKMLKRIVEGG